MAVATDAEHAALASVFVSRGSRGPTATPMKILSAPRPRARPVQEMESAFTTSASACQVLLERRAKQRPSVPTTVRDTEHVPMGFATASLLSVAQTATLRWLARMTATLVAFASTGSVRACLGLKGRRAALVMRNAPTSAQGMERVRLVAVFAILLGPERVAQYARRLSARTIAPTLASATTESAFVSLE